MGASGKRAGGQRQSVSAIREMARLEGEREKKNYDKGKDSVKKIMDPNKPRRSAIRPYDKKKIADYLQNMSNNEENLRRAMHYMYYRSQIMFKVVNWYAGIWDLRCRKVVPQYSISNGNDGRSVLESFERTLDLLDVFKVHENMYAPLLRSYLDGVVYALWFVDDEGAFPYILDPSWCQINGRYYTGDFSYAVDMSKFQTSEYQSLIEWLGSPLKEMYEEYQRTNFKYIQVPDEYCMCFKYHTDDLVHSFSPLIPMLPQLVGLCDLEDIQGIADKQSIFKLLVLPIKTRSGSHMADEWQITPDIVLDYFNKLKDSVLPEDIPAVPILGDGLEAIDFNKTSADRQVDRLKNAQDNILNISGGGAVLSSRNITSTAAFNTWLKSESEFAISSLMPQVTGFVNRMLRNRLENPCKVDFFELTVLTRDLFREDLLKANQYSYSYRLALGTLYGFSEKETLANMYVENELLKLQDSMRFPLQSSFTSSGGAENGYTSEVGQGAPEKGADEITPEGDRDRNR